jgi:hypothetical protein
MPECLLMAYYDNLDRLRTERQLDAAQAASVPHLSEQGRTSWYRQAEKRTTRTLGPAASGPAGGPALFTVNGKAVNRHGLARWLAQQFGGTSPVGVPRNGTRQGVA